METGSERVSVAGWKFTIKIPAVALTGAETGGGMFEGVGGLMCSNVSRV